MMTAADFHRYTASPAFPAPSFTPQITSSRLSAHRAGRDAPPHRTGLHRGKLVEHAVSYRRTGDFQIEIPIGFARQKCCRRHCASTRQPGKISHLPAGYRLSVSLSVHTDLPETQDWAQPLSVTAPIAAPVPGWLRHAAPLSDGVDYSAISLPTAALRYRPSRIVMTSSDCSAGTGEGSPLATASAKAMHSFACGAPPSLLVN